MCRLCELYGDETERVWYLNPKNYVRQMYKVRKPTEKLKGADADVERQTEAFISQMVASKMTNPEGWPEALKKIDEYSTNTFGYQVVPLEEAQKICDIASPLASMQCICRKAARGEEATNPEQYSCLGLGVGMFKWQRWPERYRGGVHFMSSGEAKEWLAKWDKAGYVHLAMTFGVPYIGGLCNCNYPDCPEIRYAVDYGFRYRTTKAHVVADIDYDTCNGCRICGQRCQFGALKFEPAIKKAVINQYVCFGCGLCETACPRGAIRLLDRQQFPTLRLEAGYGT